MIQSFICKMEVRLFCWTRIHLGRPCSCCCPTPMTTTTMTTTTTTIATKQRRKGDASSFPRTCFHSIDRTFSWLIKPFCKSIASVEGTIEIASYLEVGREIPPWTNLPIHCIAMLVKDYIRY